MTVTLEITLPDDELLLGRFLAKKHKQHPELPAHVVTEKMIYWALMNAVRNDLAFGEAWHQATPPPTLHPQDLRNGNN